MYIYIFLHIWKLVTRTPTIVLFYVLTVLLSVLFFLQRPANTHKFPHSVKIEGIGVVDDHIRLNTRQV
jgi:hypothetical protein